MDRLVLVGRLIVCLLLYSVEDCSNQVHTQPPRNVLTIATAAEPTSLNPLLLQGWDAKMIAALGFSFLTTYNGRGGIIPDAATVVPTIANGGISHDGKRITFHLRHDISWQDGYPLTARDVVFTFRAILNPSNSIPFRDGYDRVAKVVAPNPYTIVLKLKQPYSPIVVAFFGGDGAYPILPAHLLAAYSNLNSIAFNGSPIGSGPYRFVSWKRGDRLELVANDRYYGTKPAIRHITIRFVPNAATIVNELATREADATFNADPSNIASLRAVAHHRIIAAPVPYFATIVFNVAAPIVHDVAVRQAFASAIDRRAIAADATRGLFDPETGMQGMFTWAFDPRADSIAHDPNRGRTLLALHGWKLQDGGIRFRNGQPLQLQLIYSQQSFGGRQVVPMIVAEARAIGIDVVAKPYDRHVFFGPAGPMYKATFQMAFINFGGGLDPDPTGSLACRDRAPYGLNWAQYCNAAVDRADSRGIAVFDRNERKRMYTFVQRQLVADIPYYFLWHASEIDVIPSGLQGFEPSPISPYTSVAHWRLPQ